MQVKMKKSDVVGVLSNAASIIERSTTTPILNNVLLKAEEGAFQIIASDLTLSVIANVKANVTENGAITVGARKLLSIVKEMDEDISFYSLNEGDPLKITSGKSVFKLKGLKASEFPKVEIPDIPFVKIGIRDAIKKTAYAMSNSPTQANLNGVFVENGSMVATDGHRLAYCKFDSPVFLERGIIVPRKALPLIMKMGKEVELAVEKDSLFVKGSDMTLKVRLIDAVYPDYKRVIPSDTSLTIEMQTLPFLATLNRIALVQTEKFSGCSIILGKGFMSISCSSDEGDSFEEIEISYTGEDVVLNFNINYLLDAVAVVDKEKFILGVNIGLKPTIIKENGSLSVVMPLKG